MKKQWQCIQPLNQATQSKIRCRKPTQMSGGNSSYQYCACLFDAMCQKKNANIIRLWNKYFLSEIDVGCPALVSGVAVWKALDDN